MSVSKISSQLNYRLLSRPELEGGSKDHKVYPEIFPQGFGCDHRAEVNKHFSLLPYVDHHKSILKVTILCMKRALYTVFSVIQYNFLRLEVYLKQLWTPTPSIELGIIMFCLLWVFLGLRVSRRNFLTNNA